MLQSLFVNVKRGAWRSQDPHRYSGDAQFELVRDAVLARDKERCRFCGFYHYAASRERGVQNFVQVHHLNDDHHDNSEKNLITACTLCHSYFHIGFAGAFNDARLIPLPELKPAVFNVMQRALWAIRFAQRQQESSVATAGDLSALLSETQSMDELINERMIWMESELGEGMCQPGILASLILKSSEAEYKELCSRIATLGLRLVHSANAYAAETAATCGAGGIFTSMHPSSWNKLLTTEATSAWQ
jgi:intracellular multiplication protein IcmJ